MYYNKDCISKKKKKSLFPSNLALYGVLGCGQKPVQPKTLLAFYVSMFFPSFAQSTQNLNVLKSTLTFADWRWLVPVAINARDRRGTNSCITMSAIKHHRSPVCEAFS